MWSSTSYFRLVRRLVEACPRLEVIKCSVCIEGARRALAHAKVHLGKLDGEKLVRDGLPPGKEHRKPENYYKDVLAGARLVGMNVPRMFLNELARVYHVR